MADLLKAAADARARDPLKAIASTSVRAANWRWNRPRKESTVGRAGGGGAGRGISCETARIVHRARDRRSCMRRGGRPGETT